MPIYERGAVKIHYQESGSGFPLMLIAGGGLNSKISYFNGQAPFNAIEEFKSEYRVIAADLRNANDGQSTGPVEAERPWDSYTDDHIGLMDHLKIDKFFVMGFCIGGPFIWNLIKRAGSRVQAAVIAQPSGFRPEKPTLFIENNTKGWAPKLTAARSDVTTAHTDAFLKKMYGNNPDFVFSVTRDFVKTVQNPVLILPDDVPSHPYKVAMESAKLAPNSQVSVYPWKEEQETIAMAVRHIRMFMRAHKP